MVPSLVLAAYSVPLNAGLRMRLLVEVVKHQFDQIEHTLGLPGQYSVSASHQQQSQQHNDTGDELLVGQDAKTLLEAVMGLSIKMESGGADVDNSAGRNSIGVVAGEPWQITASAEGWGLGTLPGSYQFKFEDKAGRKNDRRSRVSHITPYLAIVAQLSSAKEINVTTKGS